MTQDLRQLAHRIDELLAPLPFAVHWQLRDIASGAPIGQGERTVLGSFSTRKVSVLMATLALVNARRLNLDQDFTITEELTSGVQAGIMRNVSAGLHLSLRDHLAQMMVTSDNICTQLVFQAIDSVTGDALQWVNDYCATVGMHDTLHREIFPRSGELTWSHSIEQVTVTSARDQALLLQRLAQGCTNERVAAELGLTVELCQFAVDLMGHLYTPLFGQKTTRGTFAEKNGRGIRGLSQVGLFLDDQRRPVASLAVFAEHIPVALLDGTPGRLRAMETFAACGQLVEQHYLDVAPVSVVKRQAVDPEAWDQAFGDLVYAVEGGPSCGDDTVFPFAGIGKLFLATVISRLARQQPGLLEQSLTISREHRRGAEAGTLRQLTGSLEVSVADAVQLMIGSNEEAAAVALLEHLRAAQLDVVAYSREIFAHLPHTEITGADEVSAGDGLRGTTTAADVLALLRDISDTDERVLRWMSSVFEPADLASALPGYGPHTVEHWTVSGWSRLPESHRQTGRTSVLLLNSEQDRVGVVAHAPAGTSDVAEKFGSLGLSILAAR